jgi:lipopolysaccharide/colanic/teichoic acid biosynthesis glycosyltransferase
MSAGSQSFRPVSGKLLTFGEDQTDTLTMSREAGGPMAKLVTNEAVRHVGATTEIQRGPSPDRYNGLRTGPAANRNIRLLPMRTIQPSRNLYTTVGKPIFDRTVAAVALLVSAVPMVVIAGFVACTMGRPILFRQRRVGRNGEVFEVLKFRTMRPDRRARELDVIHDRRETHKTVSDPRHTRVGRFLRRYSLDELPQLINVLRGEMSIIGPRPELESVVAKYRPGLEQRQLVKPGLTGLWQISARGDGPMHENGEWDLDYVERVSLLTDLRILAKTPAAMLSANTGS